LWSRIARTADNSNEQKSQERGGKPQHTEALTVERRKEREDGNNEGLRILECPTILYGGKVVKDGGDVSDVARKPTSEIGGNTWGFVPLLSDWPIAWFCNGMCLVDARFNQALLLMHVPRLRYRLIGLTYRLMHR